tara:strand:+ start:162 stop:713 length:552 start_codon:yes stop_codon:yes gene_type:complete
MSQKNLLRKRYLNSRKKKYFEVDQNFFLPLINYIKKNLKKKKFNLALYYPANFEVDVIKILDNDFIFNQRILLPVIEDNNKMSFFSWKKKQVLLVNKFGMLEPVKSKPKIPDIMLVPLLSFDHRKYRLGYGKGFYDRYLNKYLKKFKNILTVGVAFSFQKYHKLPIDKNDLKLSYILTEKGIH